MPLPGAAAHEGRARDGADGSERLAAETEGARALEVLEAGDLAGGEAREGERQVVPLDAAAVVDHPQPPHSAIDKVHGDRAGAGVEAVLEQLLQRRGGPVDDLARRDLVHQ